MCNPKVWEACSVNWEKVWHWELFENPNLQSQDMRNYIAYVNSGDNCINNAKYADAMSYYKEASNIINRTYDGNLKNCISIMVGAML